MTEPAREISITHARPDQIGLWSETAIEGFINPDTFDGPPPIETFDRQTLRDMYAHYGALAGCILYFASRGGEIAGVGFARIDNGLLQLAGAATLPAHRRHGVQSALLRTRLIEASSHGCDLAVVTVEPASKSQQNMQRNGFALLYSRAVLRAPVLGVSAARRGGASRPRGRRSCRRRPCRRSGSADAARIWRGCDTSARRIEAEPDDEITTGKAFDAVQRARAPGERCEGAEHFGGFDRRRGTRSDVDPDETGRDRDIQRAIVGGRKGGRGRAIEAHHEVERPRAGPQPEQPRVARVERVDGSIRGHRDGGEPHRTGTLADARFEQPAAGHQLQLVQHRHRRRPHPPPS